MWISGKRWCGKSLLKTEELPESKPGLGIEIRSKAVVLTNGTFLNGKIHIYCGDMDNYYLNNAVYLMEDFLKKTTNPFYAGEVDYGDRAEHCWNGDQKNPIWISRLRYHQMFIPKWTEEVKNRAPQGADLTSWRY